MDIHEGSELIHKGPCESCGSSDANCFYDDGHTFCFSCQKHTQGGDGAKSVPQKRPATGVVTGLEQYALKSRGLSEDTLRFFGYGMQDGAQYAPYRDADGRIVAQKVRKRGKDFSVTGDLKAALPLFNQHRASAMGTKRLVITEGELDAMSVSQVFDNRWPVVSLATGSSSAKKTIQTSLDFIERFEEVVFCFDNDPPGQRALNECIPLVSPGKAKVAVLPLKDASDMLQASRASELRSAIFGAREYRPGGIIAGDEMWERLTQYELSQGYEYPWSGLHGKLKLRRKELVTLTAGSGIGKSTMCREIAYSLLQAGENIGFIALEESPERTTLGLMGVHANRQFHLSETKFVDLSQKKQAEFKEAYDATLGTGRIQLFDHFGSLDDGDLLSKIKFMCSGLGCRWIFLDHISIVVSGSEGNDERKDLDRLMTNLRSLVENTGCGLILVSHLRKPTDGKGWEAGKMPSLGDLRGSAGIAQLSDGIIAAARVQEAGENVAKLSILKNRTEGYTGPAGGMQYNSETGRLEDYDFTANEFAEGDGGDF